MRSRQLAPLLAGLLLAGVGRAAAGVDVHIAIPAPPTFVVPAPPRVVVVPGVPTVQYAPDVAYNYFVYGGRYYTYDRGAWFVSPAYGGPWAYVEPVHVPRPLLGVPVRYYRIPPSHWHGHPHGMPPGQAKKLYGDDHDHGHHHHDD